MNYRLIAVDMDGTLLNSQGELTQTTAQAIQSVVKKGVIFVLTTGRPVQGVERFYSRLGLNGPVITYNGAMILEGSTHNVLFEQNLSREDAAAIFRLGLQYDTTMCIWAGGRLYGNKLNDRIHEYKKEHGVEPVLAEDFNALLDIGITKILWYDETDRIAMFLRRIAPEQFSEVTYCTSLPWFLEFYNSRASKALALEQIGHLYGIRSEEMIAIGDGVNDLSMIRYAGLGVAMENAADEVKRHAQYITSSNDEDGVRKVIETFC